MSVERFEGFNIETTLSEDNNQGAHIVRVVVYLISSLVPVGFLLFILNSMELSIDKLMAFGKENPVVNVILICLLVIFLSMMLGQIISLITEILKAVVIKRYDGIYTTKHEGELQDPLIKGINFLTVINSFFRNLPVIIIGSGFMIAGYGVMTGRIDAAEGIESLIGGIIFCLMGATVFFISLASPIRQVIDYATYIKGKELKENEYLNRLADNLPAMLAGWVFAFSGVLMLFIERPADMTKGVYFICLGMGVLFVIVGAIIIVMACRKKTEE